MGEGSDSFAEFGEHFVEDGFEGEGFEVAILGGGGAENVYGGADGAPLDVVAGAEEGDDGDAGEGGEVGDAGIIAEEEAGAGDFFGQFVKTHVEVPGEFALELLHVFGAPAFLLGFAEDEGGEEAVAFEGVAEGEEVFTRPAFGDAAGAGVDEDGAVGVEARQRRRGRGKRKGGELLAVPSGDVLGEIGGRERVEEEEGVFDGAGSVFDFSQGEAGVEGPGSGGGGDGGDQEVAVGPGRKGVGGVG